MKYLKHYENIEDYYQPDLYWLVPNDQRYNLSLKQIGCSNKALYDEKDDNYSSLYKYKNNKNNQFIFIVFQKINNIVNDWSWMAYDEEEYLKIHNFKYMGTINIDPSELIANKYNL